MKTKILFALLALSACSAPQKILEKSGSKPDWANNMLAPQYVVTLGEDAKLDVAQQEAFLRVKQEMVRSVAEQIVSTSTREENELCNQTTETYSQKIIAKASKVPYLQGVSLNQVSEVYWEKIKKKYDGAVYYRYYMKYPFSSLQMNKLVAEFKAEDMKITKRLVELDDAFDQIKSVEQIDAAVVELGGFASTLEDGRRDQAIYLQTRYRSLYDNIVITELNSALGQVNYCLKLGKDTIQCVRKPQIKSACATITKFEVSGSTCSIAYRYDGCYADTENFVDVTYRFNYKNVSNKFVIPLK